VTESNEPSSEELRAELLDFPAGPEPAKAVEQPGTDQILTAALRYVRGKRGGDLLAVILVGSGARRALTAHSDVDLIALVKGHDEGQEIIRISDRLVEIRYREFKSVEQELQHVLRLPPLLRKGRILFEHEATGTKVVDKANQRFRQGPPPAGLNEKIRLKAECWHWLGKAEDVRHQPATAEYLLGFFLETLLDAFFRLRGFWPTAPADTLRFVSSRDQGVGGLLERFLAGATTAERIATGRELAEQVFRDVPNPQRVD
jgi:predicted nucleotidyltransferase